MLNMINEPDHWHGMELRHLAALQAVADKGSFRRAAEHLGYTQSAISQQIAMLERITGARLIVRPGGPRPISLTEAGEMLLRHAAVIVARMQAAQADLAALAAGQGGTLRIGMYQSVGRRILPALMRELAHSWPSIDVQVSEAASDVSLLPQVEAGDLDLAFSLSPLLPGPFEGIELLRDPYVLIVAAGSPLAQRERRPRLKEIAALPLISFRECRSLSLAEAQMRTQNLEANIVFRSDDNGTIQALVAAGVGIALVPRLTIDMSDPDIAVIDMADQLSPRLIMLVWHRDRYQTAAAQAFIETARNVCRQIDFTSANHTFGAVSAGGRD
jgi:DNA-binding transcriptional LysR family regulator